MDRRHLLLEIVEDRKFFGHNTYFYVSDKKTISRCVIWGDELYENLESLEICRDDEKPAMFDRCSEWLFGYFSDDANRIKPDPGKRDSAGTIRAICIDDDDIEEVIEDDSVMHSRYYWLLDDEQNAFAAGDIPLIMAYLLPGKEMPAPVQDYLRKNGIAEGEVPERTLALLDRAKTNAAISPCGKLYFGSYPGSRVENRALLDKLRELLANQPTSGDQTLDGRRYKCTFVADETPGGSNWFRYDPVLWTAFRDGEDVEMISDRIIDMVPQVDDNYADSVYLNRNMQSALFSEAEKQMLIPGPNDIMVEQEPIWFDSEGNFIEELFAPPVFKEYLTLSSMTNVKYYLRQQSMARPEATDFALAAGTILKDERIIEFYDIAAVPPDAPMHGLRPMIRMSLTTFNALSGAANETPGQSLPER